MSKKSERARAKRDAHEKFLDYRDENDPTFEDGSEYNWLDCV